VMYVKNNNAGHPRKVIAQTSVCKRAFANYTGQNKTVKVCNRGQFTRCRRNIISGRGTTVAPITWTTRAKWNFKTKRED
jgi:hypothetical protein